MSHNTTAFNEYIELASVEIIEASIAARKYDLRSQSRQLSLAGLCINLCKSEATDNRYSIDYRRAFELIDWFRNKATAKLNDAIDYVEDNPKESNTYFWSHCAQVAERIVYDVLSKRVNELLEIREAEKEGSVI